MSSGSFLFVYGTLQSSFRRNRFARKLAREGILMGPAKIPGRLYGLRRYPGLRPPQTEEDWVHGELYCLPRAKEILGVLDRYEAAEYRRVVRTVILPDCRKVRAWVYVFSKALARARRIPSGRFTARVSA